MVDEAREGLAAHDARQRHCPMLGHGVGFSYCRTPGDELPCRKIFDCWFETFDVEGHMRAHFTEEQIRQVTAPRPGRLSAVLEAAARAGRDPE